MLATLTGSAFDRDGWLFEIKWDGYRALAYIKGKDVGFYSRNLIDLTEKFIPLQQSLKELDHDMVIDGELIIADSSGRSDFSGLKKYLKTGKGNPVYYVFDLLFLDGYSLLDVPLAVRKTVLEEILPPLPGIRISGHIEKTGQAFFQEAAKNGLEGIMAKKSDSVYKPSIRSKDWLKIKVKHTQDVVIGGYIKSQGSQPFRSIVAGVYENGSLVHVGNVGSGFSQDEAKVLLARLKEITIPVSPFKDNITGPGKIIWVKPVIAAEVGFSQWTPDGFLRHPVFRGIRDDKEPSEITREEISETGPPGRVDEAGPAYSGKLSNPEKVFWPDEGYSKRDLFEYYENISGFIIPHLKGRPQSLHRHPDGIKGEGFFQKDINFKPPSWIKTFLVPGKKGKKDTHYLVCRDIDSLLYMVNLGCIEINPWISRVQNIMNPDFVVIDLDPTEVGFGKVVNTAISIKEILDMLDIKAYIKTSGATGLHIYLPTGAKYDYDQVLQFARILAIVIKRRIPGLASIERSPAKRKGKVYIDYLQNSYGQTVASAYCIRPRPGAPVSTPLFWDELGDLKSPDVFNIKSIFKRLEKYGDLWRDILKNHFHMEKALSTILELYGEDLEGI